MSVHLRGFLPEDVERVGEFLIEHYQAHNRDGNWLRPAWDYMHSHPNLDESALGRIGVWEDRDRIVAVAHYEHHLGEAYFQLHPDYRQLKSMMMDHAEANLFAFTEDGRKHLSLYINDFDSEFEALAQMRGYRVEPGRARALAELTLKNLASSVEIPGGFSIKSLADENDLEKINQVLWRGFNHEGKAPAEGIADRKKMQSSPHFREDLTIVVTEPGGEYVSFCGMWYEPVNRYAYVEPMATDPDYRKLGLGRAALLEGIRRCRALGAEAAYVGSNQAFYRRIGFSSVFSSRPWQKAFE